MEVPLVDLKRQYKSIKSEVGQAIDKVLERGDFILGKEVELFEESFANFCDVDYCVGVASGTDALLLSARALDLGPGDEVILPANTFISTVLPVSYLGATPVLVDIDPKTYTLDVSKVKGVIGDKVRVIIPVHLYGHPVDMDPILQMAKEYDLKIIEDCAQAHGGLYKDKKIGCFSSISGFSFYPAKNLGAYGDAGAVVTNNKELVETIKMLRHIGQKEKYHHEIKGYNSRLDTLQAAVLLVKLKYLSEWNEKRRRAAQLYDELLKDLPVETPYEAEYARHVYHVYVIRAPKRDELLEFLKSKKIYCGIHYPIPIHLLPAYEDLGYKRGDFPETEKAAEEIISLPMFPEITRDEIEYVVESIKEFYGS